MTRESKLALIIGFVLVLVVGVLVSDHFSQANQMTLDARQSQSQTQSQADSPRGPLSALGTRASTPSSSDRNASIAQRTPARSIQTHQPVEIRNGRNGGGQALASNQGQNQHQGQNRGSILDRAFEQVQGARLPQAAEISKEKRSSPGSTIPFNRPIPEKTYAKYTVVSGDSLIRIARRELHNAERWKEIHRLNADILGPDAILKIGMTLKLPSDAKGRTIKPSTTRSNTKPADSASRSYVVQSGDTLGEISMRLLGTSKRDGEIAKLNGLESKDDIRIGMTLKIPAR
ncbi:MAG: LysM peptidoglycan-binding domain-containing protein [Phycisphaerales bacterium]